MDSDEYEEPDLDGPPTQTIVQEVAKALGSSVGDLLDLDFAAPAGPVASLSNSTPVKASPLMDDLLGSVGMDLSPAMNVMGSFTPTGNGSFPGLRPTGFAFPKKTFLAAQDCAGLQVDGTVWKRCVFLCRSY